MNPHAPNLHGTLLTHTPMLTHAPQVCQVLRADGLIYQEVEDLMVAGKELNPDIKDFDASCFTGRWVARDAARTAANLLKHATEVNNTDSRLGRCLPPQLRDGLCNLCCVEKRTLRPFALARHVPLLY